MYVLLPPPNCGTYRTFLLFYREQDFSTSLVDSRRIVITVPKIEYVDNRRSRQLKAMVVSFL